MVRAFPACIVATGQQLVTVVDDLPIGGDTTHVIPEEAPEFPTAK